CLVTLAPSDSVVAESAPPEPSFLTTESRVPSPSAKNTCAAARSLAFDILPEVLRLRRPSAFVHPERARAPVRGDAIESGFHDGEERPLGYGFELELHERRRFVLGVDFRVDAVGDPAEAEIALRLDALDRAKNHARVGDLHLRRRNPEPLLLLDDGGLV